MMACHKFSTTRGIKTNQHPNPSTAVPKSALEAPQVELVVLGNSAPAPLDKGFFWFSPAVLARTYSLKQTRGGMRSP